MVGLSKGARMARRSKKYWVAALCAASFACGQYLFGDDETDSSESLLSQYQQATKQLVSEVPLPTARRQSNPPSTQPPSAKPQQAKLQAIPIAASPSDNSQAKPQKSSRRVKPTDEPKKESTLA